MFIKRSFDLIVVLISLPLWLPLLAVIAILVRVKLGQPIFFRQSRLGFNERIFELIKFRTMTDERDTTEALLPDAKRLTGFGIWLRSTSLDELPELFNVLRGEMSLVGPRPLLEKYLPRYSPIQRRRHLVLPGITGWAQINGRNALGWAERFAWDVRYVEERSLWLDIQILLTTIRSVVLRRDISAPGQATMSEFEK